jgi:hypothetical protein
MRSTIIGMETPVMSNEVVKTMRWIFVESWDEIPQHWGDASTLPVDMGGCHSCHQPVGLVSTDVPGKHGWIPTAFVSSGGQITLLCEDCCAVLNAVA